MPLALETILRDQVGVSSGDRILVGVSGGGDSGALLHLLVILAPRYPFVLHVAHLDHGLRDESASDAQFVAELCRALGVPLSLRRIDVAAEGRRRGLGLEEAGRDLRRAFLEECAATHRCRWIALGHHRGDQAETVLHRFVRGTALSGLTGMRLRHGPYIRPLLPFSRPQIEEYLAEHGLAWVEDRSNADPRFTRNRLRHEVLPLLRQFNPRVEEHLARLGGRIALEEDYWRAEEDRVLAASAVRRDDEVSLGRSDLLALHPALRARVLRRAAEEVRGGLRGVAAVHLEGMERLLGGGRPQGDLHLPGLWVGRRYDVLRLRRNPPESPAEFSFSASGPGVYSLPDGRILHIRKEGAPAGEGEEGVEFDAGWIRFPLTIRTFRPGDYFHPQGAPGGKKLKEFFIDRKMPREERRSIPLVEADEILWIIGVCRCRGGNPEPGRPVLRLVVSSKENQTNRL